MNSHEEFEAGKKALARHQSRSVADLKTSNEAAKQPQYALPAPSSDANGMVNSIPSSLDPTPGAGEKPIPTGIIEAFASAKTPDGVVPGPPVLGALMPAEQQSEPQPGPRVQGQQSVPCFQGSETLNAAESYIRAGWHVFPGNRCKKTPKTGWSWKADKLTLTDAAQCFNNDQHNVLVALGKASNDLVDVDLDWPETTAAADLVLVSLPSFGRSGKRRSHRLARSQGLKSHKYMLPQSLAVHPKVGGEHAMCVAEIRASGAYTVFPGSEHESGQRIEWTDTNAENTAAIPSIDATMLARDVGLLTFTAFCTRFFPATGTRCDFMMAVAGALARAGYDAAEIQQVVQLIGEWNNDPGDHGAWRVAADSVGEKIEQQKEVTGLPTLIKILGFGDDVLKWCRELLDAPPEEISGPVVPEKDHMARARVYQQIKRPSVRHYRDDFYDYEAGRYVTTDDPTIKAEIYEFFDKCSKKVIRRDGTEEIIPFQPNKNNTSETIEALKAVCHVLPRVEQPHWLDGRSGPDPAHLICFPNGILDLTTNAFIAPDPKLFTSHGLAFNYDPTASIPTEWLKFLNQVFNGEQDQIDALQEMSGYCMSPDLSQEKGFMLIGPKRSGKDTIRRTLECLLSAVCGPTLDSMGNDFGMSQLIGRQLAIVGDMRLGSKCDKDLLAENILKLTGRGLFTINRKYKEHWTGMLLCKLLLISNELPKLKDTSGALPSRLITLKTRVSFYGREDRDLFRDKIKPELPGILLWALEGLRRMRARGPIAEPACSVEAREELAREASPVLGFVQECVFFDPLAVVRKEELYSAYRGYAMQNGFFPSSKDWFFRDLETVAAGRIKSSRERRDDASIHWVHGARILSPLQRSGGGLDAAPVAAEAPCAEDAGKADEIDDALDASIQDRTSKLAGGQPYGAGAS